MEIKKEAKKRKGMEPIGQNGVLWRSIQEMKEMFRRGKLLRETVPPTPPRNLMKKMENDNQQPIVSQNSTKKVEKMSGMPGLSRR